MCFGSNKDNATLNYLRLKDLTNEHVTLRKEQQGKFYLIGLTIGILLLNKDMSVIMSNRKKNKQTRLKNHQSF